MHPSISEKTTEIAAICRRHGVRRLELFGSAARGSDFDPARSDADFLVELGPASTEGDPLLRWLDLEQDLTDLLGRSVDLVDRLALERSRNDIRRRAILRGLEPIYG
ncbi:nucleotidyltransferase domain-containing protein [uncultured Thiohalocapsa sp.]|uniref:nucleotidyltransferase family protein n=1 Tax=uncultured Thiohalocapsa sp. TaxID=768990 RepID=UPI0025F1B747|nr:nucleotidyltransferase domain-containing protein [uncultured Thiohalocapsa sp.]